MLTLSQKNTHNQVKACSETANLCKQNKMDLTFYESKSLVSRSFVGRRVVSRAGAADRTSRSASSPSTRTIREADNQRTIQQESWSSTQPISVKGVLTGATLSGRVLPPPRDGRVNRWVQERMRVSTGTHPQGLYDQVTGFQLAFHDTQQGEQLRLAQVIHVELVFLEENSQKWLVRNRFHALLKLRKQSLIQNQYFL